MDENKNVLIPVRNLWIDLHLVQWITMIMIMINIGLGTAILIGGTARFTLPSYQPLIDYVDGKVWIWSVVICLAALLIATPFKIPNIVGWWIGMCWYIIWMACFTTSVLHHEDAAVTPIPVYGGLAMLSAALLTARVMSKKE